MNIRNVFSLGRYFTFESSKEKPIHSWFYYKEGFSPEFVDYALQSENVEAGTLVDPFCGVGTSLLSAKAHGLESFGCDISPLAVFVSRVKTRDYSADEIEAVRKFTDRVFTERRPVNVRWDFELFRPEAAFPPRNLKDILFLREAVDYEEPKVRDLLLLALLSILPRVSVIIKDGGVLKITKEKSAIPAKDAFKRKVKQMLRDLEKQPKGPESVVELGDARATPFAANSADIITTSPPYLNNIDYSKIYGLELTLLSLNKEKTKEVRESAIHSFITQRTEIETIPPEAEDFAYKIPIAGAYFADMECVVLEIKRLLKKNAVCYFVVGNAVIQKTHIPVDEIISQIAERHSLRTEIVVGAERIADVKPAKMRVRESVITMRR